MKSWYSCLPFKKLLLRDDCLPLTFVGLDKGIATPLGETFPTAPESDAIEIEYAQNQSSSQSSSARMQTQLLSPGNPSDLKVGENRMNTARGVRKAATLTAFSGLPLNF